MEKEKVLKMGELLPFRAGVLHKGKRKKNTFLPLNVYQVCGRRRVCKAEPFSSGYRGTGAVPPLQSLLLCSGLGSARAKTNRCLFQSCFLVGNGSKTFPSRSKLVQTCYVNFRPSKCTNNVTGETFP